MSSLQLNESYLREQILDNAKFLKHDEAYRIITAAPANAHGRVRACLVRVYKDGRCHEETVGEGSNEVGHALALKSLLAVLETRVNLKLADALAARNANRRMLESSNDWYD